MDELWQRYRTFWTPVLIGLGVFLVGVIAVHILSGDPKKAQARQDSAERILKRMEMPDGSKAVVLRERAEKLREENAAWAGRLNQTGGAGTDVVDAAAEQALRAAILRGAPEDEAADPTRLKERFDDDDVAAALAYKRFQKQLAEHKDRLRTGDPNVAWSQLLDEVWGDLSIRANRADVELGAEQLGFGAINSVGRTTLPARVLNLALVARVVDAAIRHGMASVDAILVPAQVDAANPDDFEVLWPVDMVMVGDMSAIKRVLDLLTDPASPVHLGSTRLSQPRQARKDSAGLVELAVRASSVVIRPDADLKLDLEEEE